MKKRLKKSFRPIGITLIIFIVCLYASYAFKDDYIVQSWGEPKFPGTNILLPGTSIPPGATVKVSAEILTTKKVDLNSWLEIKVGVGQESQIYTASTFEINALGFEITDMLGNTYIDNYTFTFSDFNDEKYSIDHSRDSIALKYFESFEFRYVGDGSDPTGSIGFGITTLQHGELATEKEQKHGPSGANVSIFYVIKNGKIKLTTKRPA